MKKTLTTVLVAATSALALSACEVEDTSGSDGGSSDSSASKPENNYTVAQNNAIRSAKSYLSMSGMSRRGLIQQLSSQAGDGYKRRDAVFAVNHIKVNYNREAVQAAKSYLEMGGMSRQGLIQQLSSAAGDKFTRAQAEFAADKVGL